MLMLMIQDLPWQSVPRAFQKSQIPHITQWVEISSPWFIQIAQKTWIHTFMVSWYLYKQGKFRYLNFVQDTFAHLPLLFLS